MPEKTRLQELQEKADRGEELTTEERQELETLKREEENKNEQPLEPARKEGDPVEEGQG